MVFNFWFGRYKNYETEKQRLNEAYFEINTLKLQLKEIQNQIDKLEIKALEGRKLYHKKLKELYGEEKEETKDIYNGVLLKE